jgi:hypothetical protein
MMAVRSASCDRPRRRPPTWPRALAEARWVGALANQLALKLGQRGKQIKHEAALGRSRVDGVGQGNQAYAQLLKVAHHLQQVLKGAPQAVELVDVDGVAGAQLRQ